MEGNRILGLNVSHHISCPSLLQVIVKCTETYNHLPWTMHYKDPGMITCFIFTCAFAIGKCCAWIWLKLTCGTSHTAGWRQRNRDICNELMYVISTYTCLYHFNWGKYTNIPLFPHLPQFVLGYITLLRLYNQYVV